MPILDGYQATTEIRRMKGRVDRTPIIAVTGSTMKSDQQRCLAAGMDDYLAKPLNLNALADVLTAVGVRRVGPRRRQRPVGARPAGPRRAWTTSTTPTGPCSTPRSSHRLERLGEAAGEDLLGQLATLFLADADTRVDALRQAHRPRRRGRGGPLRAHPERRQRQPRRHRAGPPVCHVGGGWRGR